MEAIEKGLSPADVNNMVRTTLEGLGNSVAQDITLQKEALDMLKWATECMVTDLFHRAGLMCKHRKRKSCNEADLKLAALTSDESRMAMHLLAIQEGMVEEAKKEEKATRKKRRLRIPPPTPSEPDMSDMAAQAAAEQAEQATLV